MTPDKRTVEEIAKEIIRKIVSDESAVVYSAGHYENVRDMIARALSAERRRAEAAEVEQTSEP